jgi:hypothetical protein
VLSGHDHHYERIERDQELYFINGLGGHPRKYATEEPTEGSVVRYNGEHGAMLVEASEDSIRFQFVTIDRLTVDETERRHSAPELED